MKSRSHHKSARVLHVKIRRRNSIPRKKSIATRTSITTNPTHVMVLKLFYVNEWNTVRFHFRIKQNLIKILSLMMTIDTQKESKLKIIFVLVE